MKAEDLAKLLGVPLKGDPNCPVSKPLPIKEAGEDDLTFLFDPRYDLPKGVGVLVSTFEPVNCKYKALIVVENRDEALVKVLSLFASEKPRNFAQGIAPDAEIAHSVVVPPYCVIGSRSRIGDNSLIFPFVYIGNNVKVGKNVIIHPMVYIGDDVEIGNNVIIFSGAVIGADGFGFYRTKEGYVKIPQVGGVIIEDDCEIGANVTIDRATMGYTRIRRGTKLDDQVHVAHNVEIGEHTVIAGQTGIAGSTKVGNWVMMGGQVGISDHVEICDKVIILAKTGVSKSILKPGIYMGFRAMERHVAQKVMVLQDRLPEFYERLKKLEEKIERKDT
ncbi:MAG: UDP-3-O-(3-hydroxymyristoyl)glucosamine N-acyltransferase [candidate division WOR-3 bacterium]